MPEVEYPSDGEEEEGEEEEEEEEEDQRGGGGGGCNGCNAPHSLPMSTTREIRLATSTRSLLTCTRSLLR